MPGPLAQDSASTMTASKWLVGPSRIPFCELFRLTNPTCIVEILLPTTEAFDRGDKFTHYKSIPSFAEYLLIAQHRPHVGQYVKQGDDVWSYREFNDLSASLDIPSLACQLLLEDLYQDVTFESSIVPEYPSQQ